MEIDFGILSPSSLSQILFLFFSGTADEVAVRCREQIGKPQATGEKMTRTEAFDKAWRIAFKEKDFSLVDENYHPEYAAYDDRN